MASVDDAVGGLQSRVTSFKVERCHASAQPLNGSESTAIVCVGGKHACPGSLIWIDNKDPPGTATVTASEDTAFACSGVGKDPIVTRITGSELEPPQNPVTWAEETSPAGSERMFKLEGKTLSFCSKA
ncbi:hypothetical protein PR003_g8934 [Phytophthora rubi]|uniref:Uncharacterized protein n=1 Tax=Phytophthora rubi TaxID=129364 RepID=A0A6A4FHN4_9STRA|nr:hypothetical protein PR003_g8934 [Phytophthora rubi]